jgi:hypothetical protein
MALDDWDDHTSLVYCAENAVNSLEDLLGIIDADDSDNLDLETADMLVAHLEGVVWWYRKLYGRAVR